MSGNDISTGGLLGASRSSRLSGILDKGAVELLLQREMESKTEEVVVEAELVDIELVDVALVDVELVDVELGLLPSP